MASVEELPPETGAHSEGFATPIGGGLPSESGDVVAHDLQEQFRGELLQLDEKYPGLGGFFADALPDLPPSVPFAHTTPNREATRVMAECKRREKTWVKKSKGAAWKKDSRAKRTRKDKHAVDVRLPLATAAFHSDAVSRASFPLREAKARRRAPRCVSHRPVSMPRPLVPPVTI